LITSSLMEEAWAIIVTDRMNVIREIKKGIKPEPGEEKVPSPK